MSSDVFSCPGCRAKVARAPGLDPGQLVECPRCGHQFPLPERDEGGTVSSQGRPELSEALRPWPEAPPSPGSRPEEEYTGAEPPPRPWTGARWDDDRLEQRGLREEGPRLEGISPDYTIDLNEWIRYAKEHYSAVLGPMIGYMLIYVVIVFLLSLIPSHCGNIIYLLIGPPLAAGFTVVCLAQLKGRRWTFGDFFGGFQFYGAVLGNTILLVLTMLACYVPGLVFLIMAGRNNNPAQAVGGTLVLLGLLPATYLQVRMGMFATCLIVDRGCGPIEAISGNWELTRGHFWGLLGVSIVLGLINLAGALLCLVGLLFAVPFTALALTAGYLLIAGTQKPIEGRVSWEGERMESSLGGPDE